MWTSALVLAAALILQDAAPLTNDSTYRLPVRVHLIRSGATSPLTTTRTRADVAELLASANAIWEAAGIHWILESLHADTVLGSPSYDSVIHGFRSATPALLVAPLPKHDLLALGWNLFLVADGGEVFGGFFHSEIRGVVLAERAFDIELLSQERGGATLAHELGHSLGLEHRECDRTRNIMANRCWDPEHLSALTDEQILQARRQAATGRPTDHPH